MRRSFYAPKPKKPVGKGSPEYYYISRRRIFSYSDLHGSFFCIYIIFHGQYGFTGLFQQLFPCTGSFICRIYLRPSPTAKWHSGGTSLRYADLCSNYSVRTCAFFWLSGHKKAPADVIFFRSRRRIWCKFQKTKGTDRLLTYIQIILFVCQYLRGGILLIPCHRNLVSLKLSS